MATQGHFIGYMHPDVQLDRSAALALVDDIRTRLVPAHDGAITLREALLAIGACEKPWGALIAGILQGEIPGGVAIAAGAPLRFDSLTVSPEFSRLLLAKDYAFLRRLPARSPLLGAPRDLGRTEVEQYLNCFPRDVSHLIVTGHLQIQGSGVARFSRSQVAQLGLRLISSREIMWRWRTSPAMREALPDHGIERTVGPFWPRDQVTRHLEALFPTGRPV